jgi:type I restriction enzyme S subunit
MNTIKTEQEIVRPYPEYKPSGSQWIGEIPSHWRSTAIKRVSQTGSGGTPPTGQQEYYGEGIPWVTSSELREQTITSTTETISERAISEIASLKLHSKGSVVIAMYGATIGRLGILGTPATVNQACCACKASQHINSNFLYHWLLANKDNLSALGQGGGQPNLSQEIIREFPIVLPPLEEQAAIVRFLDHADQQIQAYVSVKERLIALLEEERQALVHQAVTRGLDPNVRLKPSSVEWLGDVPEHWEVMPLKRAFVSMDYGISDSGSQTGGVRLLTMGNIRDGSVTVPSTGGVTAVDQSLLLGKNDLLFNRTNSAELVAKVGLFSGHDSPVTFASYLVRMRSRSSNEPEYLNMALNETTFLAQARREAVPSLHQSNLNPTRYGRIQISLPPKEEQKTILSALAEKTNGLKTSMELAHRQIELIEEYRTRLIADVVTGKIDVREAKP